jgi:hypothetical protein
MNDVCLELLDMKSGIIGGVSGLVGLLLAYEAAEPLLVVVAAPLFFALDWFFVENPIVSI